MILTVSARDNREYKKTLPFNDERYKEYEKIQKGPIRMDKSGKYDDNDLVRFFSRLSDNGR